MPRFLPLALLAVLMAGSAHSLDLSLGAAMTVSTSPYKGHDATYLPAPLVRYEGEHAYIRNTSLGVYVFKREKHKIGVGVSYFGMHFDPDDTDDIQMKQLNDRRSTMMADVSYEAITKFGIAKLKVSGDVLGKSNGFIVDAGFQVPFIRERYIIMPGVGVRWNSRKQADYYFGVSPEEALRSGLDAFTGKSNFTPYVKLEGKFDLSAHWSVVGGVYADFLTGGARKSPMTEREVTFGGALGLQYAF